MMGVGQSSCPLQRTSTGATPFHVKGPAFQLKTGFKLSLICTAIHGAESCRQAQRSEEQGTYNGAGLSAVVRADGNNNIRVAAAISAVAAYERAIRLTSALGFAAKGEKC